MKKRQSLKRGDKKIRKFHATLIPAALKILRSLGAEKQTKEAIKHFLKQKH